jgi:hypothetical protein
MTEKKSANQTPIADVVEGESPTGRKPFDEAWEIASQIAGALEPRGAGWSCSLFAYSASLCTWRIVDSSRKWVMYPSESKTSAP